MAYTVTTTAGITLATVADGTVNNSTTSLTLIGKNYAGYGIFLNENYVKLLENFSNTTAPSGAIKGQLWFDSSNNLLKVYTGTQWKPISSSAASSTSPTDPVVGDVWWDTVNAQLKVWSGSAWVTVGPSFTATSGTSGAVVETILDSVSASHVVVKFYISNSVIGILSKDSVFTPQTSIAGFTTIKPGFNLISSSTLSGSQFTGDASNALALQGVNASQFLRGDTDATSAYRITAASLTVGSDLDIETSNVGVLLHSTVSNADLNIDVTRGGTQVRAIGIDGATANITLGNTTIDGTLTSSGAVVNSSTTRLQGVTTVAAQVLPNADNTISIGASGTKFANVWATTFRGTAITAQYADLAERFEADTAYVPGTVVELGGDKEVTSVKQALSEAVFGVISTAAGFLMNGDAGSDQTHPPIAVNGRVPVRVVGKIKKGDRLVSAGRGMAKAATKEELTAFNVLGRALENKDSEGEGVIEAVVKLNS